MSKMQEIAERVAQNQVFTVAARLAMIVGGGLGIPLVLWIVSTTSSHSITLGNHATRIMQLEQYDRDESARIGRELARLQELDRVISRIEERTQGLLRDIGRLNPPR